MGNLKLIYDYAKNGGKRLNYISRQIFCKYKGMTQMDEDDFYSIANEQLWMAAKEYDESKGIPFQAFLIMKITARFNTEIRNRCRKKRCIENMQMKYLDEPMENGLPLSETIASDFNMEKIFMEKPGAGADDRIMRYMRKLSPKQREIVILLSEAYKPAEIKKLLGITHGEYANQLSAIRSYENTKILM